MKKEKYIKVVLVKPNEAIPSIIEFKESLTAMEDIIGGDLDFAYYRGFDIYCDDMGKAKGLPANRTIRLFNGTIDTIAGDFIVSKVDEAGNQISLTDEEAKIAVELFTITD